MENQNLASQYERLLLSDEEDEGLVYEPGALTENGKGEKRWCMVGRFLTERNIHYESMVDTLSRFLTIN